MKLALLFFVPVEVEASRQFASPAQGPFDWSIQPGLVWQPGNKIVEFMLGHNYSLCFHDNNSVVYTVGARILNPSNPTPFENNTF